MIIVFDSGIGGFECAKKLLEANQDNENTCSQTKQILYPTKQILYYADVENFPYGNKTKEELEKIISSTFCKLAQHQPQFIIVACNTASTIINNLCAEQKHGFFAKTDINANMETNTNTYNGIPIFDTISALNKIMKNEQNLTILSTQSTHDYLIEQKVEHSVIALPELASMIEFSPRFTQNLATPECSLEPNNRIIEYLQANIPQNCEKLLYACTHYPLIHDIFSNMFSAQYFNPIDLIVKEILTSENTYTIIFDNALIEQKFKIYANFNLLQKP